MHPVHGALSVVELQCIKRPLHSSELPKSVILLAMPTEALSIARVGLTQESDTIKWEQT